MNMSATSGGAATLEETAGGIGHSGPRRVKKLVYFQEDSTTVPALDTEYEEQNNFQIEELFRTPSRSCCPNPFANSPSGSSLSSATLLNRPISFRGLGLDLVQLQTMVMDLERRMDDDSNLPAIISDLKSQIENLRNKLETVESFTRQATHGTAEYRRASEEHLREVRLRFSQIWDEDVSEEIRNSLLQPSFDTSGYDDSEMLLFLQYMFHHLGLMDHFRINLPVLRSFLCDVYKHYNHVPFHNFRHCFCVAQMMYVMLCQVDLVSRMGRLDTLILLVSCICHDLDHPGYNNIYQINARTELALRYNDISPLENHHCSVAFRILENQSSNIFGTMDQDTFKEVREGIIRCILATDMARHNEILTQFKEVTNDFDFTNKTHRNLLSMILIKVADISNEARPLNVAEPWLDRLLTEFFQQSDLEKLEGLPVTPFMDREKITKPSSQCSFIGFVLLPLFEALGELLPALQDLIIDPAKAALDFYRKLNDAAKDERMRRKSIVENGALTLVEEGDDTSMAKSSSGLSVSRRSVGNASIQSRQRSKSSEDGSLDVSPPMSPGAVSISLEGDDVEETATEVECAEKTVKFKISTETATPGRNTCPNSRKGSRERCQMEKDCQVLNCRNECPVEDNRRKSLAVIERHRDIGVPTRRRISVPRLMDAIDIDTTCWGAPPPTPPLPPTPPVPLVPLSEPDKPSLLAKLRSLKDKFSWLDKDDDKESSPRSRTLPKAKGSMRRKGRGWRSWLVKGEGQSSSCDALPHN